MSKKYKLVVKESNNTESSCKQQNKKNNRLENTIVNALVRYDKEVKNKKRPNRFRAAAMAVVNAIIPLFLATFVILACAGMWIEFATEPIYGLGTYIANTLLFSAIAVVSVCCGIEAWKDDDENAIMHFNTNVALVALIVALIALFKEVG